MDKTIQYIGNELDLFSSAIRWKKYLSCKISPLLGADVLEVGAGIGTNTIALCNAHQKRWLCVEPDSNLLFKLSNIIKYKSNLSSVEVRAGTLDSVGEYEYFDTILYIDVLEHIKDDKLELEHAMKYLKQEGKLVVVAPAHQWLYSPFDKAIGHFRRYSRKTLTTITPSGLKLEQLYYIDSAGMSASIGNLLLLRRSLPDIRQIRFWDNWLIPISIKVDSLLRYKVGKTVIGVWKKN